AGTNGTNACSSTTAGTFATSASTTTLASNVLSAITLCPPGLGFTATSSTNTVTVTDTTPGDSTVATFSVADSLSNFAWGAVRTGSNGSNTCNVGGTAGTFEIGRAHV